MNTATRAIEFDSLAMLRKPHLRVTRGMILMAALLLSLLASAFLVIYLKDLNRRLFIRYQHEIALTQRYEVRWSKLLLEQSTLAAQARVQQIAQQRLNMHVPAAEDIELVTIPGE